MHSLRYVTVLIALSVAGAAVSAQQKADPQQTIDTLTAQLGQCNMERGQFQYAYGNKQLVTQADAKQAFVAQFEEANKDAGLTLDENLKVSTKKSAPTR